jgi:hypothetical protein
MERFVCGRLWWETTELPTPQWCLALEGLTGTVTQRLDTPSPSPPRDATHEQLARLIATTLFPEHHRYPDDVRLQESASPHSYQFTAKYSDPSSEQP